MRRKKAKRRSNSIGVIGLGIMGSAMAANLARAGFRVQGYDVVAKLRTVDAIADIDAPVVITSLPSAEALHAVAAEVVTKCVIVETSTLPIEEKVKAKETLARKGVTLLDCPLSGTGAQARSKDLVVYASGERAAFSRTVPFLKGFSRAHYYLGEFGNGSRMKFVANLLVAIHNVSAAEAFVLGMKAGLDPRMIVDLITAGAGNSRVFELRAPMMAKGRYDDVTMKISVWDKDMQVIGDYARRIRVPTPIFNATKGIYIRAMKSGLGGRDTAAVCAVLEKMAKIKRRRR